MTHAECAATCSRLAASPACITSAAESTFIMREQLLASAIVDVWIGHYKTPGGGWDVCTTGERDFNFSVFEASQPNGGLRENAEDCAALWSSFAWEWRDAPCMMQARCLCEYNASASHVGANGTTSTSSSTAYLAFVAQQHALLAETSAIVYRWQALIYAVIIPLLVLLPLVLLRCRRGGLCRTCCSSSSQRLSATSSSSTSSQHVSLPRTVRIADPVETIRSSAEASKQLRTRAAAASSLFAWATFVTAMIPYALPTVLGLRAAQLLVMGECPTRTTHSAPLPHAPHCTAL